MGEPLYTASCLCKALEFGIHRPLHSVRYCHCGNCRKFAGTSPAAWAMGERTSIELTGDQQQIGQYNSRRGIRCFCQKCGAAVWFESLEFPDVVGIPLGVLDSGTPPIPEMHLWVSSKPDWYPILDELPQHQTHPFEESS